MKYKSYTKTYTMELEGQEREITIEITPPDISIRSRFDPTRQGLQTSIISIAPPCCITDEMDEMIYDFVKSELVNH